MRSAVGLMLSHGVGESVMSRADYEQTALHHSCLLVLLRGVGPNKPRSLQKIFDKVRRVNNIKVNDSGGLTRDIWVRYIHDHPVENNDWGDFQTHRRLLGLVTIGKFDNQTELNELCRQHESLKVRYGSTLIETRAIFFGPAAKQTKHQNLNELDNGEISPTSNSKENLDCNKIISNDLVVNEKPLQDEYTTPANFKSEAFFYREQDPCLDLEARISDFVNYLFWVLESRRLKRSHEKSVSLLYAPYEKRDFVGLDMESRNNRKRCAGRSMKNFADLSLQTGLIEEALTSYHNSIETLNSINDALWLGAAEEGLCAASAILLYPQLRDMEVLHRNASLQEGSSPLRNTPEKWRSSDFTKTVNSHETQKPITTASSSCSSVSSLLTGNSSTTGTPTSTHSSTETSSSSTSTVSAGGTSITSQRTTDLPGNILKPNEIGINYRNAIINYSKYRHAAIIEIEAALKAARICIEQNRPLDVAMFLQNILYIYLEMSDQDRCKLFEVITELYQQIGYKRKAAFFQHLAAMKHVHLGNKNPDWSQTYRLLLESFPGYMLSLDPLEVLQNSAGWPSLQIDLIQNLIAAAIRLGLSALATRHMTFLLQTQWNNMSSTEQRDMAVQLQNLSAQCEGSPVPLVLQNGTVIPPANLTDLPFCIDIAVKDLPAHLRPQRIKIIKADSGPFLFTPIHFNSIDRRDREKDKNKIAFLWVQNDLCDVTIRLRNPLPFELIVSDMRLLTNGPVFESLPQTVVLQPNVSTHITLHGTPIEVGQLEIQGYSTHALGVKSNCRMKHMLGRSLPSNFLVEVIPALPKISVKTSLPQTATFSNLASSDIVTTSANLTLYNGESTVCIVTITNDSKLPVEHLEVVVNSNVEMETQKKIFKIDELDIQTKLPLQPNETMDFTIEVYGEADFICPIVSQRAASVHSSMGPSSHVLNNDYVGGGSQSLQYSIQSSESTSLSPKFSSSNKAINRRNDMHNLSFRSISSTATGGGTSMATLSLPPTGPSNSNSYAQHVEAQFRIKYSGGDAMEAGYCRQCAIAFNLELLPSAQITSWDVLPAEIPSQFYLVLDVSNLTAQEMSLNYTNNKSILIEAKESCRVPIPVERCSLEQVTAAREADLADNVEKDYPFRSQILSFEDSISKLCSEHIAERVKIHWCLTSTDIQGIASLRGIILTPAMIDLTTVSPLQWTISFHNEPVQPQSEVICTAGQRALLSVTVCNQSLQPLKNLVLTIKFYRDYLNGMENYNLETRVAISGPNRISIPLLKKHESVEHECSVVFFTPGRFKTNIQCCSKPSPTTAPISTNTIPMALCDSTMTGNSTNPINPNLTHSYPLPEISTSSQLIENRMMLNECHPTISSMSMASYHDQQEHIWKFIPPIEITVVEQ